MKSTIGVYKTHEKAVQALDTLKKANFPLKKVSLIGNAELVNDHVHVKSRHLPEIGASIGVAAGSVLGVLTGIGVFTIPGFGFLYGAGALVGAFAGFDMGAIGGGLLAIMAEYGVDEHEVVKYDEHLKNGKVMLIVQGDEAEIQNAKEILHTEGSHEVIGTH